MKSLSGWWHTYPSEKYDLVNWDDEVPNIHWKKKKFQITTNQKMLGTFLDFNQPSIVYKCLEYSYGWPKSPWELPPKKWALAPQDLALSSPLAEGGGQQRMGVLEDFPWEFLGVCGRQIPPAKSWSSCKIIGKSWENHGKTPGSMMIHGVWV